jgi:acyl carrier protein
VVLLEALPLTANGKVDRAALPDTNGAAATTPKFAEPETDIQRQLATIWAEVLKKERVGRTDNFLALGGHSLLAIRALGKISKSFGVRLPLRTLFEASTLEQLAEAVERARASA